ncbi:glycophorin-A isoform X2 [Petaurus breviceps papuanus]|uniref:glycophorin-A isoform X2 n=1 Tax=Petaurus breviceps papuanus TaxID=3040969 RepID=UPI0036DE9FCB
MCHLRMYEKIVLLLLLSGNVSTQETSLNKTYIFLPLTSQKPVRHQRKEELPVTEDPGHIATPVTSQKPTRRQRKVEMPVMEEPGDISTEETYTHKPCYVSMQEAPTHSHKEHLVSGETTLGFSSIKDEHSATQNDSVIVTQEPGRKGSKGHITHPLSGPVVAVIVFAAIAGIVGVILFSSFLIRRLTRRSNM